MDEALEDMGAEDNSSTSGSVTVWKPFLRDPAASMDNSAKGQGHQDTNLNQGFIVSH